MDFIATGEVHIKVEEIKRRNIHMKEYLQEVKILMKDIRHLTVRIIHYFLQVQIFVQHRQTIDRD